MVSVVQMTCGCQTWSLNKQLTNKLRTAQRAMKRKMLDLKRQDKVPRSEIRKRTNPADIIKSGNRPMIQQVRRAIGGPNTAQSGNQGE